MNDLVGRLRYAESNLSLPIGEAWRLLDEAASAIERLAQENERLKAALLAEVARQDSDYARVVAERDTAVREKEAWYGQAKMNCYALAQAQAAQDARRGEGPEVVHEARRGPEPHPAVKQWSNSGQTLQ